MALVVLVVEDNEDNLLIVATILRHYGYEVITAGDGEAALEAVAHTRPHLVLLDISLPVLDGWDVAHFMKSNPDTAGIPIGALTAHAYAADRAKAEQLGFSGFLTKPIDPLRIVNEVRQHIGAPV